MASENLVETVKRKLRITYDDPDTDARVEEMVADAEDELRYVLGIHDESFDFDGPGAERSLLVNLCFYEDNGAADEFWANYAGKIAQCREKWIVMQFAENEEPSADV